MGGHVLTRLASERPGAFRHLVLIDPVIVAPNLYRGADALPAPDPADHPVAHRRNQWAHAEEMRARFADRAPYSRRAHEVLADSCAYGLLPTGAGYQLACPRPHAATMYKHVLSKKD